MMSKFKFVYPILIAILLSACGSSQASIETAIAKTQAAWTPTFTLQPTSTVTPHPTATSSCTDRGWGDIATYLKQFDQAEKSASVGSSIAVFLKSLTNYEDKINNVAIDACTEHARQQLISGMGNEISGLKLIFTGGSQADINSAMITGASDILSARSELQKLGIPFNYP
jgi:hypothetical protein